MYLHLGRDVVVSTNDILGIFDLDNSTVKKSTRDFLEKMQRRGEIVDVSEELPKSFILCQNGRGQMVYLSQISPATLLKRAAGKNLDFA